MLLREVYDEHELRPTDIRITDVLLGEGAYGKVYKGTLIASRRNVAGKAALATELTDEVAAKVLHSHASDQTRLLQTYVFVYNCLRPELNSDVK